MHAALFKRMKTTILAAAVLALAPAVAWAASPQGNDLTAQFVAGGVHVSGLRAVEVGGIVVLRGDTYDPTDAQAAGAFAQTLGYSRVANLIRVVDRPDDARIERTSEENNSDQSPFDSGLQQM